MTTQWLLQHNMLHRMIAPFHEALINEKQSVQYFGFLGAQQLITTPEDFQLSATDPLFVRSGTGLLRMLLSKQTNNTLSETEKILLQGIFYHPQHFDQAHQHQLQLPLLNQDAQFLPWTELQHQSFHKPMFVKPSSDLKGFTASILPPNTTLAEHASTLALLQNHSSEICLVSEVQPLISECRFFVVDGIVITGSYYRHNDKPYYNEPNKEFWKVAQQYTDLFHPAKAFVIDIALTSNHTFKIVEYNCINCSGTYNANLSKLIQAINNRA